MDKPRNHKNYSRAKSVPSSRTSRLAGLGLLAGGIAGRTLFEGARRLSRGELPDPRDLLLTPTNMLRIANELARMRGAAMKLGQLISMDAGDFLPPELAQIMDRLRDGADFMPKRQLEEVLARNWGADWAAKFEKFEMRPIAAASIGQVHYAKLLDGQELAIKVQYPGIRRSIDSDIDNVVSIFKMSGFAPPQAKLSVLVKDAKEQLHAEADYLREAAVIHQYASQLGDTHRFAMPMVYDDLSSQDILAMTFVGGQPIEAADREPQAIRDAIITDLLKLSMDEVFKFGLTQTDPNFANFKYHKETETIGLLDFGAAIELSSGLGERYKAFIRAGLTGDRTALKEAAKALGLYSSGLPSHQEQRLLGMMMTVFRQIKKQEVFDFAIDSVVDQIRSEAMALAMDKAFQEIPPTEIIYLQRKLAGMYLLARRLKARVRVQELLEEVCSGTNA